MNINRVVLVPVALFRCFTGSPEPWGFLSLHRTARARAVVKGEGAPKPEIQRCPATNARPACLLIAGPCLENNIT